MEFEWDEAKAKENSRKHGVTFIEAALAFGDSFAIELIDDSTDYGEERSILFGMSNGQILTVIYAQRDERIRIISARRATKHEQDYYYRENAI
jgi:uncharacterized DUF497 family protein